MKQPLLLFFFCVFLNLYCSVFGLAQIAGVPAAAPERPKVGLVLSGGGAKGMAHVGVLKVLEEVGIRPDYITGTSMGSIIGGLYAIGYSAEALEQLILSQNWSEVLSDRIPLQRVIFEEKPFFENQLAEFDFEHWQVKVPSGLNQGQQISKLLSRLTLPAVGEEDFRNFPIPFLCNGADMTSGKSVILDAGDLAQAMRTSMAIPTVFTPVQKDGQILVDGGLVHNFAVREVIDMGADIVIGVYTGRQKAEADRLEDLSDLLVQSFFLMGIEDAEKQLALCDLYIEPDLQRFSSSQFFNADSIMRMGELAARSAWPQLERLRDSLQQFPAPAAFAPLPYPDFLVIHAVEVEGNQRISGYEITGRFDLKLGKPNTVEDIEAGIDRLFGTNAFEKVTYRIRKAAQRNHLVLEVKEKPRSILKTAINYDTYHEAGLLLGMIRRNFGLPASRLMVVSKLADNYRFRINYLKYITQNQQSSVVGEIQFNRDRIPIFQQGLAIQEFKLTESILDLKWQRRFGRNVLFGLGVQREKLLFRPLSGVDPGFRKLILTNHNLYSSFSINSLDRNIFPRSGLLLETEGKLIHNHRYGLKELTRTMPFDPDKIFGYRSYLKVSLQANAYIPVHRKASIVLRSFAGYVWNPENTFGDFYLIGSPQRLGRRHIPFSGLDANEQIAVAAFGGSIGWQQFVNRVLMFRLETNLGFFQSPENLQLPRDRNIPLWGLGFTLGYQSFLGPIELTFSLPLKIDGTVQPGIKSFLSIGHRF